jgi:CheY-like chemotaxis protein
VLVVDDTEELGLIVRHLGRRTGQEVVVRGDVAGGWAFLQERRPDLVLLDVNLPGPSGLELCRLIRATPALAGLPVALFSHWQMTPDIVAGLEAGVDFVVSKELVSDPEAWQARLREILSWVDGRRRGWLLSWLEQVAPPKVPANWVALLNRALRHPSLRRLQPPVLRFLLGRALRQAVSSRVSDQELDSWLLPDHAVLAAGRVPPSLGPAEGSRADGVLVLGVALAEQIWYLLGTEASAPFRAALAPLLPGLEECLSS